jgi:RNA polymerase sigma-70 factor, ECF subfamily
MSAPRALASFPCEHSGALDEKAFEILADHRRPKGFRLALKITGCPEAARDAVQEALMRAFRGRRRLRSAEGADAWFRKILVRCALNGKPTLHSAFEERAIGMDADLLLERLHVRRTLARLKPEYRALLALAVGEELSYAVIAQTLEIPIGTVGSRLSAAREAFRKEWNRT